jgi:hypothetical protein
MNLSEREKAVLQLAATAGLPMAELDARIERASDVSYWRALNPALSIDAGQASFEAEPLSLDELTAQREQLGREGYFQTRSILDSTVVGNMRACVEDLLSNGWPAVFAFLYDQFWNVMRTPSLKHLVTAFLGEESTQTALIWTFHVPSRRGAGGWLPHSDDSDGASLSRLTVWVPLSDATIENGCIYAIPRDRMPENVPANYSDIGALNRVDLGRMLQAVKALPSPAGALLGWDQQLIHWGSCSSGRAPRRISIGAQFIAKGEKPGPCELPLIDGARLPAFEERLRLIGKAILEYRRTEPLMHKYAHLAHSLAHR